MARLQTLQELFKRYRRPGDVVFACAFLVFAVFLLSQIRTQAPWLAGTKTFAQPAFWSLISLALMSFFAALHFLSSILSPRIPGRWQEVWQWVRSFEYVIWFMIYVFAVPWVGYLPTTIVFAVLLGVRAGYRSIHAIGSLVLLAVAIVVVFKAFLQVKIPGGALYHHLPDGLRAFMLTYL